MKTKITLPKAIEFSKDIDVKIFLEKENINITFINNYTFSLREKDKVKIDLTDKAGETYFVIQFDKTLEQGITRKVSEDKLSLLNIISIKGKTGEVGYTPSRIGVYQEKNIYISLLARKITDEVFLVNCELYTESSSHE